MNLIDFKNRFKNCSKFVAVHESDDGRFIYRIKGTSLTIRRTIMTLIYNKPRSVGATVLFTAISPNSWTNGVQPSPVGGTVIFNVNQKYQTKFFDASEEIEFEKFMSQLDDESRLEIIYNLTELSS